LRVKCHEALIHDLQRLFEATEPQLDTGETPFQFNRFGEFAGDGP
jgi:hypothetical protein